MTRTATGRWIGLVLALVTAIALVGAGRLDADKDTVAPAATTTQPVARVLACSGLLPGSAPVVGSAAGRVRTLPGPGPVVRADAAASGSVFASESAAAAGWFAAQSCPEPSARHWFLGAGGSRQHSSTLAIRNPRSGEAVVDIRVFGPDGEIEAPGLLGISLRRETREFDLAEVAPAVGDLAVSVSAVRGLVSASLADSFARTVIARADREFVPSQGEPAEEIVLGGLPDGAQEPTLLLFNPDETSATVKLSFVGPRGTFAATDVPDVALAPGGVRRVAIPLQVARRAAAVRVEADRQVVAGLRSRAGQDVVFSPVALPVGGNAVLGLPSGKRTLRLVNPDRGAEAVTQVRFLGAEGRPLRQVKQQVAAGSAAQLAVPDAARAVMLVGGDQLRAVVQVVRGRGQAVLPVASASGESTVPAVVPGDVAAR